MKAWFVIIIIFTTCYALQAQTNTNVDPFGRPIVVDTTYDENDTTIVKNGFFSLFKGKPGKAALCGLLIPSGGQIYNKRWWKVPLALAVDGGLTYVLIHNRKQYKEAQNLYQTTLINDSNNPRLSFYRETRNYYQKWSEYAWIWLIGGHLMTVIDAYVDRHLMDFDVSPDISINTNPTLSGDIKSSLSLQAGIKIKLSASTQRNPNYLVLGK